MNFFLKKGVRIGVLYISKRYRKANNKYLTSYHSEEPTKYIAYLEKHNLYVCSMFKSLLMGVRMTMTV